MPDTETLEGYVVDLICLREYPAGEYAERARRHTRVCALKGHCVESGYGLVDEDGHVALLDPAATPQVVGVLQSSGRDTGIRLRVRREEHKGEMATMGVHEVDS